MANPASLAGFAGAVGAGASFAFKNRIINGDMRIDQRNNGASVTPTASQLSVDRWQFITTQPSKASLQQNAGSVTPPAGFSNYVGITSLSAYSSLAADTITLAQRIEGFNIADLAWGTASASPVTVSFLVRSSLSGTFGGSLRNSAADRSYPFAFVINSVNTWEYKTITIPGDTTGTWLTNNGVGVTLYFNIGNGGNFNGTAGSWASANYTGATGGTNVTGTNGATFYITGVQLEKGSVATPFEFRSIGQELALCQRYYEVGNFHIRNDYRSDLAAAFGAGGNFLVSKRDVPSITVLSNTGSQGTTSQAVSPVSVTFYRVSATGSATTGGQSAQIFQGSFSASSEL